MTGPRGVRLRELFRWPSPLEREIAATRPGFAVVMLGTNETYAQGIYPFARNLLATVDALLGHGVVPVL